MMRPWGSAGAATAGLTWARPRRRPLTAAAGSFLVIGLVVSASGTHAEAATPSFVAAPPSVKVRLSGPSPTLPSGASLIGPAAGASRLIADVSLEPRDPAGFEALASEVSTPGSPVYRHYLARGQFAALFGPSATTLAGVRAWLASAGLGVGATPPDGLLIPVTGTVAKMENAFGVPVVETRLRSGRMARMATANPEVPASLAGSIGGVIGLSTVAESHPQIRPGPGLTTTGPGPAAARPRPSAVPHGVPAACPEASALGAWTADQLAGTYGLSSLYGQGRLGAGQQVGIYELEPFTPSDIASYESCFGVDAPVSTVSVDGGATGPQVGEAALDIEMAAGLAPSSGITVYSGPNDQATGPIDTYTRMVTDDSAKVLTTSWGQCEGPGGIDPAEQQAEKNLFTLAMAQGQTVFAAAGDSGSSDCYDTVTQSGPTGLFVDDPADQPDVTGVGGTSLTAAAPDAPTETVWNDIAGAGGGGVSVYFARPSWQSPGHSGRQVPDVSASSDPEHGDVIFFAGRWNIYGGTSAAAPLWAALTADSNQGCAVPAGFLNQRLYAAGSGGSPPFNDITVGSNNLAPNPPSDYPATPHYDLASGWGSPQAVGLMGLLSGASSGCPSVTGLSPSSGPATGGRTVVITGSGFGSGVPTVRFGPVPAAVTSHTPTSVTVTTPDVGSAVQLPATVTTSGVAAGTSAAVPAAEYTFVSPQVTLVVPDKGPTSGGGQVTVTGSDFSGSTSVRFGSSPSPSFTVLSSTSLVASVPPGPAGGGVVDVTVRSPDGTSPPVVGDRYTYALPGYWLAASDGGVFSYGAAAFHGSAGGIHLNRPIVGMASTPDGGGYWLVAADGGIFSYGDAAFHGSAGGIRLNQPIVGMARSLPGSGYWLVASDGGIFSYGDAGFYGSAGGLVLVRPMVGMAPT